MRGSFFSLRGMPASLFDWRGILPRAVGTPPPALKLRAALGLASALVGLHFCLRGMLPRPVGAPPPPLKLRAALGLASDHYGLRLLSPLRIKLHEGGASHASGGAQVVSVQRTIAPPTKQKRGEIATQSGGLK